MNLNHGFTRQAKSRSAYHKLFVIALMGSSAIKTRGEKKKLFKVSGCDVLSTSDILLFGIVVSSVLLLRHANEYQRRRFKLDRRDKSVMSRTLLVFAEANLPSKHLPGHQKAGPAGSVPRPQKTSVL